MSNAFASLLYASVLFRTVVLQAAETLKQELHTTRNDIFIPKTNGQGNTRNVASIAFAPVSYT
jgi:hypothetical protein